MSNLTLYTNPSSRGQICHWMLEELQVPYNLEWVDWGPHGHKGEKYLKINPMGKIPSLVHGDAIVTEAAGICLYLADTFPEKHLNPSPEERANYYRWILFAAGPVEHAVTAKAVGWDIPKDKSGMIGFGSYDATIATLEGHLAKNEYVCGTRFTAADVYVGSSVAWGLEFGTIPKRSAFEAYAQRLGARDAFRTIKSINDEKRKQG